MHIDHAHRRLTSITPGQPHPSVFSVPSVRNPSPSAQAVMNLKKSDLPEPLNPLGCRSVARSAKPPETAERVA